MTTLVPKKKISVTIDLEDHRKFKVFKTQRYEKNTLKILSWLEKNMIKATFFTVGQVAENSPKLVKLISNAGHSVAHHSYSHRPLTISDEKKFLEETKRSKSYIEDLIGKPISGFRAPFFSLTKETIWATEILKELGFYYSSSVVPVKIKKGFGYKDCPYSPFLWPSGLLEIPMTLSILFGKKIPTIGGLYLRYLPTHLVYNRLLDEGFRWTYIHPQDIDTTEPFTLVDHCSFIESSFCYFNKKRTFPRLEKLLKYHDVSPFEERVKNIDLSTVEVFKG